MANTAKNKTKSNKKMIILVCAIVVALIAVCIIIAKNTSKNSDTINVALNEEFTLNKYGSATLEDDGSKVVFTIDSNLNYKEGEEFKVPYKITVNDVEYSGEYTFGNGYSVHNETNNMTYKVNFIGIEKGTIRAMIYKENAN